MHSRAAIVCCAASLYLATLGCGDTLRGENRRRNTAPAYSVTSIVNSATYTSDALAPNCIASIFGTDLSFDTAAISPANSQYRLLPDALAGVSVIVGGFKAKLYYVSPTQINFLMPSDLRPGDVHLFVARQGTAGPTLKITVHDVGPGLYELQPGIVAATHADNVVITGDSPARAGDIVVLYGTGLGRTDPDVISGEINMTPAQIVRIKDLRVLVSGTAVSGASILYAGVTPGTPGLYQVNVALPQRLTPNPEIRIAIGDQISPAAVTLLAR
jgi:uncharacterized protein (TIGR03437 family)